MLATLALVGAGFAWTVVRSYRRSKSDSFQPEGKLRWTDEPR